MSKSVLIGLLIAALAALGGLVWMQQCAFSRRTREVQEQFRRDAEMLRQNRPFTPAKSKSETRSRTPGGALSSVFS